MLFFKAVSSKDNTRKYFWGKTAMITSNIEKRIEEVSYLTLRNSTQDNKLVSIWVDDELFKLTMIEQNSQKKILLGTIRKNAKIMVKEQA
ncbi:hypothetical protein [Streptococcus equinus]|uniref:hypothetical protein n=1 Tax=Streptococcus equinus TaxID=1335 RepID=UPI0008C2E6A9|nr:hypothetical protein [Streptococcus equinus]SEI84318.1 hypothetical protein SAMN05216423_1648 [Streptococcus equinus]